MRDLHLVGVHQDGEHVVLADAQDRQYRVPLDEALRGAVRSAHGRLAQAHGAEDTLRPRDIQHRIRAGYTTAEIASSSGLPVDYVRKYEGPVLAEREHVVLRARGVGLRRRDGVSATLGQTCDTRLARAGVDLEDGTAWDAWRNEDGTWTVQLQFADGPTRRVALWRYDMAAVHLTPGNDQAEWLSDEPQHREDSPASSRMTLERVLRRNDQQPAAGQRPPDDEPPQQQLPDERDDGPGHRDWPTHQSQPRPRDGSRAAHFPANVVAEDAVQVSEPRGFSGDPPPAHPADSHPEDWPDATVLDGPLDPGEEASGDAPLPGADDADSAAGPPEQAPGDESPGDDGEFPGDDRERPGSEPVVTDSEQPVQEQLVHEEFIQERPTQKRPTQERPAPQQPAEASPRDDTHRDDGQVDGQAEIDLGVAKTSRRQTKSGGSSARRNRPSVPSWDDILFGSKKE